MDATELLTKKTLVETWLRQTPAQLSAFSFVNIFAWKDFFRFEFKVIDDNLCVFARHELGTFLYLPPLGRTISPQAVADCFALMRQENRGRGVTRIENVREEDRAAFPGEKYVWYKKGSEYVYPRQSLAELKGVPYKSRRSLYNHFVKNYPHEYFPFDPGMAAECLAVYDAWAKERKSVSGDPVYQQMLEENRVVHSLAFRHYRDLGLTGRVVKVDGAIKAYTFGYPLNDRIFCDFLEIADRNVKGLSVYIFKEFCADPAVASFSLINAMDDWGIRTVAQTKQSFKPSSLFAGYVVTERA